MKTATIFVVDDDVAMQRHLARVLKNYTVRAFSNGIDAIQATDLSMPDLIILDIILDGPSGFALIAELQSYPDTAQVPVVIFTSVEQVSTLESTRLKIPGVVARLDKTTTTPDEIRAAVAGALK